ncbi:MAG TPA: zf-HC2 domain-containing protein [Tepidisphaeraceae bacterium]|jgi:anti-sigma factor RsiW|nr:zf-HC2 domain-containing protein [Tepidisphaeraceae bacterium]
MQECPFEARLSAFYDDELDAGTSGRLKAHLADCPSCSASLQSLRQVSRLIASAPVRSISLVGMARLHAAADAAARQRTVFPMAKALLAVAASALIVGSAWLVEIPGQTASPKESADVHSFDALDSLATGGRLAMPHGIAQETDVAQGPEPLSQWMIDNFARGAEYENQHR